MGVVYGILALIAMIIIHEFGHFLAAKLVGVKVERFSVGFGKILLSFKTRETEYALSLVPLGGYVKMKGENVKEFDKEKDREGAFFAQPVYKRMIIVFAGPFFNMISAVLFFFIAYLIGITALSSNIGGVVKHSVASQIGIKPNDTIIKVGNQRIHTWDELSKIIKQYPNKNVVLTIDRNGKITKLNAMPKGEYMKNLLGYRKYVGFLGVSPSGKVIRVAYPFFSALYKGFQQTFYVSKLTIQGMVRLIELAIPAKELGGPIMIVDIASKAAQTGFSAFLLFVAIISINLGILNLLPIPILDGGHLAFFTIEAIKGKPISEKTQIIFQNIGLGILIAIMLFAFYNDFNRFGVTNYVRNDIEKLQ